MGIFSVAKDYLVWHYSTAYVDLLRVWWNYLWFVNHLFSVPDVLMTWFAPFKRLQEERANILLHPEDFFGALFVNFMMRLVGFLVRTALLSIALLAFLVVLLAGFFFLALWTVLPVLLALLLRASLVFLFQ
jgi:hypothetical protein